MKKNVRDGVFETNSSSCHSVSLSQNGRRPNEMTIDRNGVITITIKDWNNYEGAWTQSEKLSYLISLLWARSRYYRAEDIENFCRCYEFRKIEEAIYDYVPDCMELKVKLDSTADEYWGLFDHQILNESNGVEDLVNIYDKEAIIDFIFNEYLHVDVWHD